mgnify:FL=1
MSFDKARNDFVSTLTEYKGTINFKGTVLRAGSFIVDGVTHFVFTIKNDDGAIAVFTTAPNQEYFHRFFQGRENPEPLLAVLLTYASLVRVGDRVDVMALNDPKKSIIHFIEPEPETEELVRSIV